jgi:rfaE bifunctional protein nucleotidyltransferase chain/domain
MRVIYTAGVWDLLHRGHLNILWRSKALGDVLVVGVVSDAGTAAYKGRRPVQNVQARMEAVKRLGFVDVVELQHTTDPSENLYRFRPDVMTHGDDWSELLEGNDTLAELGIEFRLLPYTDGVSTTLLRDRKVSA